jgi:ABC-type sugar transport system substrate-binding protein
MASQNWSQRQVGDFEIGERIGRGGTASVYRARQRSVNRSVALKLIDLGTQTDGAAQKRFTQEAALIASLEHLHILPIYGYGLVENEFAYFATRLMNRSLADVLRGGALPFDVAARLFLQIASGLQYAHERGVVHRDIKPSNILLDDAGNAYLGDFGVARHADATADLSGSTGSLIGTPAYMSPEQVMGQPADQVSDIYSLGVMLYHMLTGHAPFATSSASVASILYKQVQEAPRPPREHNPAIPPQVEAMILRMMEKNPKQRYISVEEVATEFRRAALDQSRPPFKRRPRTVRQIPAVYVVALLILLLFGTLLASRAVTTGVEPLQAMTVLDETRGGLDDLAVSDHEIALAQARLGSDGFIAYFSCTLRGTYMATRAREMGEMAGGYGLAFRVYNSEDDAYLQSTQIEQARLEGARAIILCPLNADVIKTAADSLEAAQIPLVFSTTFDHPYGVKLELANYDIGLAIGRYAGEIIRDEHGGRAEVALLGFPGFSAGDDRTRGMRDGLAEIAPDATIIGEWRGFTRQASYETIHALIADGTHFDAILSINDTGTMGAIEALEEALIAPQDVFIVSANGEAPIVEYVRAGYFVRGTVEINREMGSRLLLHAAIKALAGSPVPELLHYEAGSIITRETARAPR